MRVISPIGQTQVCEFLTNAVQSNRIASTQLFTGSYGYGLLPLAVFYAAEILSASYPEERKEAIKRQVFELKHPDLHFVYPINYTGSKELVSTDFISQWREFLMDNPYQTLDKWLTHIGVEKKQGLIRVKEAEEIHRKLSLKSFSGGYKVLIIWYADIMNTETANKLLKLLEEPLDKTVIILLSDNHNKMLPTILSRCQQLQMPRMSQHELSSYIKDNQQLTKEKALQIALESYGDLNNAFKKIGNNDMAIAYESLFIDLVRSAFQAKGNKQIINKLISWGETLSQETKVFQSGFLEFSMFLIRQALLENYNITALVSYKPENTSFELKKFAPFINASNVFDFVKEIENAQTELHRNVNAKMIFTNLAISFTKLIHKKQ